MNATTTLLVAAGLAALPLIGLFGPRRGGEALATELAPTGHTPRPAHTETATFAAG